MKMGPMRIGLDADIVQHKRISCSTINKKTIRLISRDPVNFKTITTDNGTEFYQYKKLKSAAALSFILLTHSTPGREAAMKI